MENELIYLASPFTTDDLFEKEMRFLAACDASGFLMQQDRVVFSPIAHGWPIAKIRNISTDWSYWEKACTVMLERCQVIIVLMLPGWKESTGVKDELKIAKKLGLKIQFMNPDTFEISACCDE